MLERDVVNFENTLFTTLSWQDLIKMEKKIDQG